MAWLQRRGTKYRICFRYAGELLRPALGTSDEKEAEACRARLVDTLNRLERGWLKLPPDVDLTVFLLSGGRPRGVPPSRRPPPLRSRSSRSAAAISRPRRLRSSAAR